MSVAFIKRTEGYLQIRVAARGAEAPLCPSKTWINIGIFRSPSRQSFRALHYRCKKIFHEGCSKILRGYVLIE